MLAMKVVIVRFICNDQPGWVECKLNDAFGREWTFHEKVPVVSSADLSEDSSYPQQGVIACQITGKRRDSSGRDILTINTVEPWDIETIDGEASFEVLPEQIMEIQGS